MSSSRLVPPQPPAVAGLLGGLDLDQLLLALLMLLLQRAAGPTSPAPGPPVIPPAPTPPAPPVVPVPQAPTWSIADRRPTHRINGGTAHLTGMVDMIVPRVQTRLADDLVDRICAGTAAAPVDVRIETDCTPSAEDGYVFGPNDEAWLSDPQPGSVDDPEAQPMRLLAHLGAGLDGGLRHEYPNFGCDGWLRVSGHGEITGLRYVGPSYGTTSHAEIPLTRRGAPIAVIRVG
jgi:hypothetical protein